MDSKTYIAIDLKSFYASVECIERGLNPLTTNLVVADASRTEKTICLAVSPSLRKHGIPGRARLFEVVQKAKELNLEYITATPQMSHYIACSTKIYNIYLQYIAAEDIHVYSIDEVFIDATDYLAANKLSPREFAMKIILHVLRETGITATAGIGTNLYLSKVAMDIGAKHIKADKNGVRIAELDEVSYRRLLWNHRPLTDFWRVGRGYAKKLERHGLFTMGDVARCSIGSMSDFHNEELLYDIFGVNAELLIDHAWGWEPCTIADVKAYKPRASSIGSGQVLQNPYTFDKARIIVREMTDLLVLDLVDKGLVTNQLVLTVGYDIENLKTPELQRKYKGKVTIDNYGRPVPKHAHGTENLDRQTSSTKIILDAISKLYDCIVDSDLLVRRINVIANNVVAESELPKNTGPLQLDMFTDYDAERERKAEEEAELAREKKEQEAILNITKKYGKNAILKGMNFEEGAMTKERNNQIGGHKA